MRESEIFRSIEEFAATLLLIIYINYCWSPWTQQSFSKNILQVFITLLAHFFFILATLLVSHNANFCKTKQSK